MINKSVEQWQCPFCKEWCIEVMLIKGYMTVEKGFTGRSGVVHKKGSFTLLSDFCPKCGKAVKRGDLK